MRIEKLREKRLLLSMMLLVLLTTILASTGAFASTNDINEHWAEDVITEWVDSGLTTGYPDGTFRPNNPITRAEFMTLTNKAFDFTAEEAIEYNDVSKDNWFAGAVKKAQAAGYIGGYPDGSMKPNNPISRQEAANIIFKLTDLQNNPDYTNTFNDAVNIPDWSKGQIGAVAAAGYMGGYPDGNFKPLESITRAEALVALNRVLNEGIWIINEAGIYGPEEGRETFDGDVYIKADGVVLQNTTITGSLTITEEVGEGEVTLDNVIVEGDTYIKGGGPDSIYINGGGYKNIIIQKAAGKIRIVMVTDRGASVIVAEEAEDTEVILEGTFENINVNTSNVTLTIQGVTTVKELNINHQAEDVVIKTSKDTVIDKIVVNTTTYVINEGRIKEAVGSSAKDSEYEVNLPENLLPRRSSSSGGISTPPPSDFAGGTGTEVNPYQVATAAQLDKVRDYLDKHFIQMADINLGVAPWNTGAGWVPIGTSETPFTGSYDGNGKTINNLKIDRPDQDDIGLFGKNSGTISNVSLVNIEISGNGNVGGLIGHNEDGIVTGSNVAGSVTASGGIGVGGLIGANDEYSEVTGCFSTGAVSSSNSYYIGGLIGRNYNSPVTGSYSTSSVSGGTGSISYAGGLVGTNYNSTITNCYATGDVTGNGEYAGGLVGTNSSGMIINCYATGAVMGIGTYIGGLVGGDFSGTVSNSYWDIDTSGRSTSAGGTGYTTSAMIRETSSVPIYEDWDFLNIWAIEAGESYPYLQWQGNENIPYPPSPFTGGSGTDADPYQVATADQLNKVRNYLDAHFIQTADIDLGLAPWNEGEGWEPIGGWSNGLAGSYNGNGFIIENLTIDYEGSSSYKSLFQELAHDGLIENVQLKNVNVKGNSYVSALVAYQRGGEIRNCFTEGTIRANNNMGGLVAGSDGLITGSYSSGSVIALNITGNNYYFGGLVGRLSGTNAKIYNSYSTADVLGDHTVGGLVGTAWGHSISNSYSIGKVSGTARTGGLIGQKSDVMIVNNSYWDIVTSEQSSSDGGTGYVTSAMILETNSVPIYIDWDFTNTWTIEADESYPYLQWQGNENIPYPPSPFAGGSGTDVDPYQVATAEQLDSVRDYLDKHFIQTADINLGTAPWNEDGGWEPIGNNSNPFNGSYDGDIYKITGLTINRPSAYYQGLFGYVQSGSVFSNIHIEQVYIYADEYIGSLAGYSGAEINDCSAILITIECEDSYAGGLVGQNMGSISNSYTSGTVKADYMQAGGLVGYNYYNASLGYSAAIENCYSDVDVSYLNLSENELDSAGGLVGYNSGGSIIDCYALGDVTGHEDIGGLVGENFQGTIIDCYAEGDVTGTSDYDGYTSYYVGGLIGVNGYQSLVKNSYAEGNVSGYHNVGGLAGYNSADIEDCSAYGTVFGYSKVGGLVGDNSGSIIKSFAKGNISGSAYVGGLSGYSSYGTIQQSFAEGNVNGGATVGGLVGSIQSSSVNNCYATGDVSGTGEVGGLVGYVSIDGTIENCYATGSVSGSGSLGGLVGAVYSGTSITSSYYDQETTGRNDTGKGEALTTNQMTNQSSFIDWNFESIWGIDENISYPYLLDNLQNPKPAPHQSDLDV